MIEIVSAPSVMWVSGRFAISRRAPTSAAACWASTARMLTSPPAAPRDSVRICSDIVIGVVLGQRAAAADLDVVGMGADRQHALLLATAARVHGLGQQQRLLDEFVRTSPA